jgi:tartrate dehydratase beta subunit/fumarate hydratase class I family protein
LIGEDLGVGTVAALEVEIGSMRVFVYRDDEGNAVGTASTSEADAMALRQRLSL